MRIAFVHDWLLAYSGAERVLMELHALYPEAPIYTLCARPELVASYFPNASIITSSLQRAPFIFRAYRWYTPLAPTAIESFDLSQYDTVVSSSAFFAHGVVVKPRTRHICYCYTPMRSLWDRNGHYAGGALVRHALRIWDRQAAGRVDEFIAISR